MAYETAEQRKKRLEREKNQRTTSSRWSSSTRNYSNLPNPFYDPAYYDYSTPSSGSDCDTSSSDSSSSSCDTSTSSDY